MLFSKPTTLAAAAAAFSSFVQAASPVVHTVSVGDGGLKFSPETVTAKVGEFVRFKFAASGHSVAESTFGSPCQAVTGSDSFFSGTMSSGGEFTIEVTSTDPIFFYCATQGHCQAGMSGVINPTSGETLAEYQSASKSASNSDPGSKRGDTEPGQANSTTSASGSASPSPSSTGSSSPSSTPTGKSTASTGGVVGAGLIFGAAAAAVAFILA